MSTSIDQTEVDECKQISSVDIKLDIFDQCLAASNCLIVVKIKDFGLEETILP